MNLPNVAKSWVHLWTGRSRSTNVALCCRPLHGKKTRGSRAALDCRTGCAPRSYVNSEETDRYVRLAEP